MGQILCPSPQIIINNVPGGNPLDSGKYGGRKGAEITKCSLQNTYIERRKIKMQQCLIKIER
jgi:hypothetical protein